MLSVEKVDNNTFRLRTDDPAFSLKDTFEYPIQYREWNFRAKRFEWKSGYDHLYSLRLSDYVEFKAGFAPFILYHFGDKLTQDSIGILEEYTFNPDPCPEFTELRETQPDDLAELLRFRRGIFSVFTGYGKTQVISKLVNHIVNERHEKVLVITPSSQPLEEIKHRVKKLTGLECGYFDYESNYNAISINGFLRSGSYDKTNEYWSQVKWIVADECEYCLTDKSLEMMNLCKNVEHCYGFSGTADKSSADRVAMRNGMNDVVQRNKTMIGAFGFSIVHRLPDSFDIDIINIKTTIFNDLKDLRMDDNTVYSEVIKQIFIDQRFCSGLEKIVKKELGGLYIPMGRLEVIYEWLRKVFIWKDVTIANICGNGIELWKEGQQIGTIDLGSLKNMVANSEVKLITGTKSSYRAIDLPELDKIITLTSQLAASVLQQIGRVARKRKFKVFLLTPTIYVSCYTNDLRKRKKMISEYYSACNLRHFTRTDIDYGIF